MACTGDESVVSLVGVFGVSPHVSQESERASASVIA